MGNNIYANFDKPTDTNEEDLFEDTSTDNRDTDASDELEDGFKMPEKFSGKSAEDVARAYTELETAYGKQATEFGDLRKIADKALFDRMESEVATPKVSEQPQREAVTFDDLVEDPDTAVDKLVSSKLKDVNDKLDNWEKEQRFDKFKSKFPDFNNDLSDTDFQTWVQASKYRTNLFVKANSYDTDASDELWTEWGSVKESKAAEMQVARAAKEEKQVKDLKKASSETGSTGSRTRKVYKRIDLINQKATDPDAYYANIEEYKQAYRDKRVK